MVSATMARPTIQAPAGVSLAPGIARRVIDRVARDRFYIGHTLDACMRRFDIDEEELAALLGCSIANLAKLALHPRPDPRTPGYGDALERIAARTGVDARQLASILELTEVTPGVASALGVDARTLDAVFVLSRR
jgi:hypothetical protein